MNLLPLAPKQGIVDSITQQHMLEGEADRRRNPDSVDNVGLFELREDRYHVFFVKSRCGGQEIVRELTPDHSSNLHNSPAWRDAIEPFHQCVTQRLRNPEQRRLCCARGSGLSRRTQGTACQFLYE